MAGVGYDLVKADVRLVLRNPGRATFTAQAEQPLKGLVAFDLGYNDKPLQRHFLGYVERSTAANSKQQVLFCRELAAILAKPMPMNLRHVDLRAVLEEASRQTGLRFRVPDRPYALSRAPYFYSLAAGYQAMESLAQVYDIPDFMWQQQGDGEVCPRFGVDVQVLLPDGEPDPALPVFTSLPLTAPMGGQEAGMFGFPEEGTTVVASFAYGLPHKPFIQQILPHGLSLPRVPKGDQVWQHSEACQQRVDADGNWLRQTDGKIHDKAIEREVDALSNTERYQSHLSAVDDHSTETIGGIKKVEALGALKLLSGGSASLAAVDDLHQAIGRDLNLVVGQKLNATIGGDYQEQIQGLRRSVVTVSQRLQAPKTWMGSEGVNVLPVLCDLLDLVERMNQDLAAHTHGPSPVPSNAGAFAGAGASTLALSQKLKPVTL